MSTHTRPFGQSVSLVWLAAVLATSAGCAANKPGTSTTSPTTSMTSSTASGSASIGGTIGGTVSAETATIYRATPVEFQNYELQLASLQAQTSCNFASEDGYRAGSEGWKVTLRFNLKDEQEDRWSRQAGPMRITSMVDDSGVELASKVNTKSYFANQHAMFLRPSRRSNASWQSL